MRFSSLLSVILIALLLRPLPAQGLANAAPLVISVVNNDGNVAAAGSRAQRGFTLQISDSSGAPVADAAIVLRFPDTPPTAMFADGTHAGVAYTDSTGRAEVSGMQWSTEPGTLAIKITATKGVAHAGIILEQRLSSTSEAHVTSEPAPLPAVSQMPPAISTPVPPSAPAQPEAKAKELAQVPATPQPGMPQPGTPSSTEHIPAPAASVTAPPAISVVNRPSNEKLDSGGGHKKWIILLVAIAAGAGAGIALAGKKSSSSSANASTSTGTTIGSPTVNVGAP